MSGDEGDVGLELERARILCGLRRFDEASSVLHQLLAREQENAPAWCLLAQAQLGVGDPYGALESAGRATALEPENDWPHRLRCSAFQDLGIPESAVAAAREAVRTGPDIWGTHALLARSLVLAKGDLEEAWAAAERAVALAPNEPDTHYTLGIVAQARRVGDNWEAERHFRAALALDPQHAPSHNALASRRLASSSQLDAGNLADAAAGFRNVVQSDPRADYGARNLELVFRTFLGRLSYLIFVIAIVAARLDDPTSRTTVGTAVPKVAPPLLLLIPIAFAVYFVVRLEPDLRSHLFYVAFHGRLAAASIAQACALAFLLASAFAAANARIALVFGAVVAALVARIFLAIRGSGRVLSVSDWRSRRLSFDTRWFMIAVAVATILFVAGNSK